MAVIVIASLVSVCDVQGHALTGWLVDRGHRLQLTAGQQVLLVIL